MSYETLSPERQVFVDSVLAGHDPTKAYMEAYGASLMAARSGASRLLGLPEISLALEQRRHDRRNRLEVDQDALIKRLISWVEADPADYLDEVEAKDGSVHVQLKPLKSIPPEIRKAMVQISRTKNGWNVKTVDRLAAARLLLDELNATKKLLELVDFSQLTQDQIDRLSAGEHPVKVLVAQA